MSTTTAASNTRSSHVRPASLAATTSPCASIAAASGGASYPGPASPVSAMAACRDLSARVPQPSHLAGVAESDIEDLHCRLVHGQRGVRHPFLELHPEPKRGSSGAENLDRAPALDLQRSERGARREAEMPPSHRRRPRGLDQCESPVLLSQTCSYLPGGRMIDLPVFGHAQASLRLRPDDDPVILEGSALRHVAVGDVERHLVRVPHERVTVASATGAPREGDVARDEPVASHLPRDGRGIEFLAVTNNTKGIGSRRLCPLHPERRNLDLVSQVGKRCTFGEHLDPTIDSKAAPPAPRPPRV